MLSKNIIFSAAILFFSLNLSAHKTFDNETIKKAYTFKYIPFFYNIKNKLILTITDQEDPSFYIIKPGDTKYSLSKKFGMSIEQLEQLNPNIVPVLKDGEKIRIKSVAILKTQNSSETNQPISKVIVEKKADKPTENVINKNSSEKNSKNTSENFIDYVIKPKETLYSLSKKAGVSTTEFAEINPALNNGVQIGMIIKMPKNKLTASEISENQNLLSIVESVKKNQTDAISESNVGKPTTVSKSSKNLIASADKTSEKKLFIVIPFSKNEWNQFNKNDASLDAKTKSQIDFLKGVQLGIDNVKKQGLKLNIEWISSQELETQKTLQDKIKNEKAGIIWTSEKNSDINLIETYASEKTPVIFTNPEWNHLKNNNVFNALPNTESERIKVLEYLKSQKAQIVVIQDRKDTDQITRYCPNAKFIMPDTKGYLDANILKQSLSSTQFNFVILDTAKSSLVISTTTTLLEVVNKFKIQLTILESDKIPDNEKISQNRFKILKMLYPTTQIATSETANFSENPVLQNIDKTNLNLLKGYDVTTDTALRLFQDKSFKEIAEKTVSQQLITRFNYQKNDSGSYFNTGINLMQLDINGTAQVIKP